MTADVAVFGGEPGLADNGLARVTAERADLWRLQYERTDRSDELYEHRLVDLFLRPRPAAVVAAVVTAHSREPLDAEGWDATMLFARVEVRSSDCLVVQSRGGDTIRGPDADPAIEASEGADRRAPDRVPAAGLDGFGGDMSGAWTILPEGGLARATACP